MHAWLTSISEHPHLVPALIRPEMMQRLREHQRCGHKIMLVSASHSLDALGDALHLCIKSAGQ
ncbi:hypothetical protein EVC45_35725 [Paraburkholderia sp. UYCP14C]|uniref:hypothetical protein n=1 Tax=Paraburkholderia sp. UYCP14C TaxID=2511130 RepID=UPI0010201A54|nr:hypothetical protein [Paraburkholderia sp. UYCP14C]RZF24992.1 hypothetical protein EVC45_35725 [Paraburkholderia sp. UYCP14C]